MGNRNTKAYLKLREQIQEAFDFVYVVSQAVPCMKLQISLIDKGEINDLPAPDYFTKPNPLDQISAQVKGYKSELSKYILLSSFSYFESFIVDVIEEVMAINGGPDEFAKKTKEIATKTIQSQGNSYSKQKVTLSKQEAHERDRRLLATSKLTENNFVFPSSLLSHLGVKALSQKLGNLKSVDIPKLMQDAFCMEWNDDDVKGFHQMRETRNRVAHGKTVNLSVKDVVEMNTRLRDIAHKVDQHLIDKVLISEPFRL